MPPRRGRRCSGGPRVAADATELIRERHAARARGARKLDVPHGVYASTVWVYGTSRRRSSTRTRGSPPAHLYTAGKLAGELYCRAYGHLYGVESTIVRFGIPHGPRARASAVVPRFVARAFAGEALSIAVTGDQQRAFVYVEDLAEGVVASLTPAAAGRTYNLVGRVLTTIRGLAEIVQTAVAPVEIVHTPGRAGDLRGASIRSDRAERELGWRATTPLCEGVKRYADWVAAQPPAHPVARNGAAQGAARVAAVTRRAAGGRPPVRRRRAAAGARGRPGSPWSPRCCPRSPRPAGVRSSTTESSRTTRNSTTSSRNSATSSRRRPTPRSSRTASTITWARARTCSRRCRRPSRNFAVPTRLR